MFVELAIMYYYGFILNTYVIAGSIVLNLLINIGFFINYLVKLSKNEIMV